MRKVQKLLARGPQYAWQFLCAVFFDIIGRALKIFPKYQGIWIIAERGRDARDNGYWLFRHIRENHPEIKAYYIIDKESPDYDRIAPLRNVVQYRSFKHHLLFAVSDYKISTHICGYAPDILPYNRFGKLGLVKGKLVFLQHGIIANDQEWMFYPNTRLDLFVCGARREYEEVKKRYGYPEGVVQPLGLCRYDALLAAPAPAKRILVMPTWRGSFGDMKKEADFQDTQYFRAFQSLINNKGLLQFLEEEGLEMVFYPHTEAQKFIGAFSSPSGRVVVASEKDYDVQELLKSSAMLITDYSSVAFDFAYMGKPMAYFQFDMATFRKENYKEGYFSYEGDGFGPVFHEEADAVKYIKETAARGFVMEEGYKGKAEGFFSLRDTKNCQRNFEAICKL